MSTIIINSIDELNKNAKYNNARYESNHKYYLKYKNELLARCKEYRLNNLECYKKYSNVLARLYYYNKKGLLNDVDHDTGKKIVKYMIDNNMSIKNIELAKNYILNNQL